MTTNDSIEDIMEQLEQASMKDVNIKIDYHIATSVDFLDVTIVNEKGRLRTSVYHKSAAEPYILPFTSDHPRHVHRNIPYAALLRAARLCSHVEDFHAECIRSDVSLLLNDYPPAFITKQRDRFFHLNEAMSVWKECNEQNYHHLHHRLVHTLTRREKLLLAMIDNPIEKPSVLQSKTWDVSVMYPRYLFDRSMTADFQQRFHAWWKKYYVYRHSRVLDVRVRLIPYTNSTLENFLVRKKPPKEVLTKLEEI